MIYTIPSDVAPASASAEDSGLLWNASHIMLGSSSEYYWRGAMSLSIKCFFDGTGFYDVGAGHYAADERSYLVLNHGQPYSITIDATDRVSSFIIFFATGFAEEVYRSMSTPVTQLLDEPQLPRLQSIRFFQKLYTHDDLLSPALFQLRQAVEREPCDLNRLREQLHEIMQRLLQVHWNVYKDLESLPATRAATREELYRRVYRARDFLAASFAENITLNDMAQVACLSPNHFLRTFKHIFRQTPHQYLIDLRLEKAKSLLTKTFCSVTDICMAIGFDSLGSFSSLFRRRTGLSPEQYRKQKSDFEEVSSLQSRYTPPPEV